MKQFYKQIDYEHKLNLLNDIILLQALNQIIADYAFCNEFEITWAQKFDYTWKSEVLCNDSAGVSSKNGIYFSEDVHYIQHSCDIKKKNIKSKFNYSFEILPCLHVAMFLKNVILWNAKPALYKHLFVNLPSRLVRKAISYLNCHFTQHDAMIVISAGTNFKLNKYVIKCWFVKNFAIKEYEAHQVCFQTKFM